jgi:predicted dehydrogenase
MTRDGMNYAPDMGHAKKVVPPGEFLFAAAAFDHGHIYGQIEGLAQAGGTLRAVWDDRDGRVDSVLEKHPECRRVERLEDLLDDPSLHLITGAAIPSERCALGLKVLDAGKDYLTDKSPFTTLDQLAAARNKVAETGRKYMVCYSERFSNESAWHACELARGGAVGRILQVLIMAPHNLAPETRPDWFFQKEKYGGILTDIGSHQFDQFLAITGALDADIEHARVENFANPDTPGLEDFGEALLTLETGASAYCRLDWFNPAASRTWGDGRTFILGEDGYMEVRKYVDVARGGGDRIFLVNQDTEEEIQCAGKVGFPFFGRLVLDVLNRTEHAMTQEHAFQAAELSMRAQQIADQKRTTP